MFRSVASLRAGVERVRHRRRSEAVQNVAHKIRIVLSACAQADALWRRIRCQVPTALRDMRYVAAPFPGVKEYCAIPVR